MPSSFAGSQLLLLRLWIFPGPATPCHVVTGRLGEKPHVPESPTSEGRHEETVDSVSRAGDGHGRWSCGLQGLCSRSPSVSSRVARPTVAPALPPHPGPSASTVLAPPSGMPRSLHQMPTLGPLSPQPSPPSASEAPVTHTTRARAPCSRPLCASGGTGPHQHGPGPGGGSPGV